MKRKMQNLIQHTMAILENQKQVDGDGVAGRWRWRLMELQVDRDGD